VELGVEGSVGARADFVEGRCSTAARRHHGYREVDRARGDTRRGEERARGANEKLVAVERRVRPIYSPREKAPGIAQKRARKKIARELV
jgi:hypothetical protein